MADKISAKGGESKFRPHPEGQFVAKCVDTIDLGEKVEDYPATPKKLSHKCDMFFRTGEQNPETNEVIELGAEFTGSMNVMANFRKSLDGWGGKAYRS